MLCKTHMQSHLAIVLVLVLTVLGSCAAAPRSVMDSTSSPVSYNLRLTVRDGQLAAFRALMHEMVEATKAEPGTLVYEWFLAADGKTCHINEHFADTAAHKAHGDNFGARFAARFMPCVEVVGTTVYGNPSDAARERLAGLDPVYLPAIGGFRR